MDAGVWDTNSFIYKDRIIKTIQLAPICHSECVSIERRGSFIFMVPSRVQNCAMSQVHSFPNTQFIVIMASFASVTRAREARNTHR